MLKHTYLDVFSNHNGYVSDKWIHYLFIYDKIFHNLIEAGKSINLLEIGVQNGGSLEIWKKYLPEGSQIHGVDIDKKCCGLKFSENIYFHLGNATDLDFLEKIFSDTLFDVILDDGSHFCKDVINTFTHLFPKYLRGGGVYVVEDFHTSYFEYYNGDFLKKSSSMEFFKHFADAVNFDYIPKGRKNKYLKYKPFNLAKQYSKLVESVTFYDSICAINKYRLPKEAPFTDIISGKEANITACASAHVKNSSQVVSHTKSLFV
jgi:hypothetical protein